MSCVFVVVRLGRRMNRPEEDVEIGATSTPTEGAFDTKSDVFDAAAIGEVVTEEGKLFEALSTE
jgi:hypothetical protein